MTNQATYNAKNKGFTLTELLVVIFIMVILMGIGALSIMQNNSGRGLNSGIATLQSAINEARTVAMSKGTNARMVINNDPAEKDKYRRQIVTLYQDESGTWEPAFRSVSLPSKVFLDPDLSVSGAGVGSLGTDSDGEFSKGYNPSDVYVQFNKLGICSLGSSSTPGASLGLVSGRLIGGTVEPNGNERAGIVVWRNGSSTLVNDVTQIAGE